METQKKYYGQVRSQYFLIEKEYALAHASTRDSMLYDRQAMIITEFEQSGSRYLQSLQSRESARMQLTQVDMQIEQSEETLLDLEKQAFEEKQTQAVNLRNATDQLQSQLTAWEQRYLLRSPVGERLLSPECMECESVRGIGGYSVCGCSRRRIFDSWGRRCCLCRGRVK